MSVQTEIISTHAPAGGATKIVIVYGRGKSISTHAPAGGATHAAAKIAAGRVIISTHAPAGGATFPIVVYPITVPLFLLTPLREGRRSGRRTSAKPYFYFYSRPCGRGD